MTKYLHTILAQGYYSILTIILASLSHSLTVWTLQKYFVKIQHVGIRWARNCIHFLVLDFITSFHENHWGMRWSCFCFWQKNHLILKVLGEDMERSKCNCTEDGREKRDECASVSFIYFSYFYWRKIIFPFLLCVTSPMNFHFFVGFLEGLPS